MWPGFRKWVGVNSSWQNVGKVLAVIILAVELFLALEQDPVDQRDLGMILIAAGLLGLASLFRRNGNGRNGSG